MPHFPTIDPDPIYHPIGLGPYGEAKPTDEFVFDLADIRTDGKVTFDDFLVLQDVDQARGIDPLTGETEGSRGFLNGDFNGDGDGGSATNAPFERAVLDFALTGDDFVF